MKDSMKKNVQRGYSLSNIDNKTQISDSKNKPIYNQKKSLMQSPVSSIYTKQFNLYLSPKKISEEKKLGKQSITLLNKELYKIFLAKKQKNREKEPQMTGKEYSKELQKLSLRDSIKKQSSKFFPEEGVVMNERDNIIKLTKRDPNGTDKLSMPPYKKNRKEKEGRNFYYKDKNGNRKMLRLSLKSENRHYEDERINHSVELEEKNSYLKNTYGEVKLDNLKLSGNMYSSNKYWDANCITEGNFMSFSKKGKKYSISLMNLLGTSSPTHQEFNETEYEVRKRFSVDPLEERKKKGKGKIDQKLSVFNINTNPNESKSNLGNSSSKIGQLKSKNFIEGKKLIKENKEKYKNLKTSRNLRSNKNIKTLNVDNNINRKGNPLSYHFSSKINQFDEKETLSKTFGNSKSSTLNSNHKLKNTISNSKAKDYIKKNNHLKLVVFIQNQQNNHSDTEGNELSKSKNKKDRPIKVIKLYYDEKKKCYYDMKGNEIYYDENKKCLVNNNGKEFIKNVQLHLQLPASKDIGKNLRRAFGFGLNNSFDKEVRDHRNKEFLDGITQILKQKRLNKSFDFKPKMKIPLLIDDEILKNSDILKDYFHLLSKGGKLVNQRTTNEIKKAREINNRNNQTDNEKDQMINRGYLTIFTKYFENSSQEQLGNKENNKKIEFQNKNKSKLVYYKERSESSEFLFPKERKRANKNTSNEEEQLLTDKDSLKTHIIKKKKLYRITKDKKQKNFGIDNQTMTEQTINQGKLYLHKGNQQNIKSVFNTFSVEELKELKSDKYGNKVNKSCNFEFKNNLFGEDVIDEFNKMGRANSMRIFTESKENTNNSLNIIKNIGIALKEGKLLNKSIQKNKNSEECSKKATLKTIQGSTISLSGKDEKELPNTNSNFSIKDLKKIPSVNYNKEETKQNFSNPFNQVKEGSNNVKEKGSESEELKRNMKIKGLKKKEVNNQKFIVKGDLLINSSRGIKGKEPKIDEKYFEKELSTQGKTFSSINFQKSKNGKIIMKIKCSKNNLLKLLSPIELAKLNKKHSKSKSFDIFPKEYRLISKDLAPIRRVCQSNNVSFCVKDDSIKNVFSELCPDKEDDTLVLNSKEKIDLYNKLVNDKKILRENENKKGHHIYLKAKNEKQKTKEIKWENGKEAKDTSNSKENNKKGKILINKNDILSESNNKQKKKRNKDKRRLQIEIPEILEEKYLKEKTQLNKTKRQNDKKTSDSGSGQKNNNHNKPTEVKRSMIKKDSINQKEERNLTNFQGEQNKLEKEINLNEKKSQDFISKIDELDKQLTNYLNFNSYNPKVKIIKKEQDINKETGKKANSALWKVGEDIKKEKSILWRYLDGKTSQTSERQWSPVYKEKQIFSQDLMKLTDKKNILFTPLKPPKFKQIFLSEKEKPVTSIFKTNPKEDSLFFRKNRKENLDKEKWNIADIFKKKAKTIYDNKFFISQKKVKSIHPPNLLEQEGFAFFS